KMLAEVNVDAKVIKKLGEGLNKLSNSASDLGDVASGTKKYNTQMLAASDNLEKINDLYKNQITSSQEQFKATQKITGNLTSSLDQSARLQVEFATLSENINALNNVYGNMLSAMTTNPSKKK
ncbi:MAG: hypothetical protein P8K69_04245, partial [Flavobacteriales bacterium]|nr:hypothetical protein [Flavobacteriales bacterium]